MKMTLLETPEDFKWLEETHGINLSLRLKPNEKVVCALLKGNEDVPYKIETYARNDINCPPERTYLPYEVSDELCMVEISKGHLRFHGQYEYFGFEDSVYKANIHDLVTTNGTRDGRFECYVSSWDACQGLMTQ